MRLCSSRIPAACSSAVTSVVCRNVCCCLQVRRSLDLSLAVSLQDEISVWISGLRQLSATQLFPQQLQLQVQQQAQQQKSPLLSALRASSATPLRVTPFNNEVLCVPALLLSTSSHASSLTSSAEVLVGPQDLQVQSALRHPRYLRPSSTSSSPASVSSPSSSSSSSALLRLKTATSGPAADLSLCLVVRLRFVQISAASKSAAPYLALPLGGAAGGGAQGGASGGGAQGSASAKAAGGDLGAGGVEICRWTLLPLVRSLLGDNASSDSSSSSSAPRYLQSGHIALPLFVGEGPDAALLSSSNPYSLLVQRLKRALDEDDPNTSRSRSRSTNNKSASSRSGSEKVLLDPEGASVCLQIAHPLLSDCVDLDAAVDTTYMQSLLRAANASADTLDHFVRPLSRPALPPSSASVSAVDAEVATEGCSVAQMVPKCGALLQLTAGASAQERELAVKEVLRGAQDALQMALRK